MDIASTKISSQHQVVVPLPVRKALGLGAGDVVTWIVKKNKAELKPRPKSWTEYTLGLGKKAWKGIEATKYIRALRDEWE